jgi:4'-phosphopantetheinyl transferase EntD
MEARGHHNAIGPFVWPILRRRAAEAIQFECDGICGASAPIGGEAYPSVAEELATLGPAAEQRAAEFVAGRHCARLALSQLGVEPTVILRGAKGAPSWPAGTVGSIAHGAGHAIAVVARSERYAALGFDIERRRGVTLDLHRLLFTAAEHAQAIEPDLATVLFSAKESIYKAVFPRLCRWIDFTEVTVRVDGPSASFRAYPVLAESDLALLLSGTGSFTVQDDTVMTLFRIAA